MKKLLVFLLCITSFSGAYASERMEWPYFKTDLPFDKSIKVGRLDNGFRYLIKKNNTPKERAAAYLGIMAGSLYEKENQRGVAHFLEHMVFCGSKNFEPGELIKYFQRIGMSFGADTNAHTNFDETVYKIYLPKGTSTEIEEAFLVLKDFAANALISQKEVDRERGVILSEKVARDSVESRTREKIFKFLFNGLLFPNRFAIGTEEVIKSADSKLLTEFYKSFYTPNRMVLAVTGDVDVQKTEHIIKKFFSDLEANTKVTDISDFGTLKKTDKITGFYYHEKEAPLAEISINFIKEIPDEKDSIARQQKWLKTYMASMLFSYRLNALLEKADTPYQSAHNFSYPFMNKVLWSQVSASSSPDKWQDTLTFISKELKKVYEFGFLESETKRIKKEIISMLERDVETALTRDTQKLAADIISSAMSGEIIVSPKDQQTIFTPYVKSLTKEDLNKAFKEVWDLNNVKIAVTGNPVIGKDAENIIEKTAAKAFSSEIESNAKKSGAVFPYLVPPEKKSEILKEENIEKLGIKRIFLSNNACLNLKKTDFKKDSILIKVGFGKGRAYNSSSMEGYSYLLENVLNTSNLNGITTDELNTYLAGKKLGLNFGIDSHSFYIKGFSSSNDLNSFFELLYHYLNDPGVKENAYNLARKRFDSFYKESMGSVDGMLGLQFAKFFAGKDARFGVPSREKLMNVSLDNLREYAAENFNNTSMEVSVVGDFDEAKVKELFIKYFSYKDKFKPLKPTPKFDADFPKGKEETLYVDTKVKSAFVMAGLKTTDIYPVDLSRRLNIAGSIIDERLRENIREKLGVAYSPFAYHRPARIYRDYGGFFIGVKTVPQATNLVKKEIINIINSLKTEKISDDEFERAKLPFLNSLKTAVQTNDYWLESVLYNLSGNPVQLKWAENMIKGYLDISKTMVEHELKKYLMSNNLSFLIIESKHQE